MTILAIDPGYTESAYALIREDCGLARRKDWPPPFAKCDNETIEHVIDHARPDHVVIERLACYGMPVGREVLETCEWVGRFDVWAHMCGAHVDYVYRREVKLNLCGNARAKDGNVRQALIDRFAKHDLKNGKGTKARPDWFYGFFKDVWQAYAVGVTWVDSGRAMHENDEEAT